ncbi:GNAT family N-acetyltransferase [Aeromonas aquatica]|uniref:GNAT family N-acetyltransferase n=1 Tax=Aeromonas aquatica TaxID=558964 RepID=UPI00051BA26A|nr:GNAT family N-acetyltransferase [Aeromonas aquatica]
MSHPSTATLRLSPIQTSDLPHIYRGLSDPDVIAYYGVSYHSLAACQAQMDWYAEITRTGSGAWFLIRDPDTDEPVGAVGYNGADPRHKCAELGYWLYPEYWGKGIMGEALALIYHTTDLHRLLAVVEEPNTRSARLLERAGFHYEGTARESEVKAGGFISLRHYAILRSELPSNL